MKNQAPSMIRIKATPPTTPPAIAPVEAPLELPLVGCGDVVGEVVGVEVWLPEVDDVPEVDDASVVAATVGTTYVVAIDSCGTAETVRVVGVLQ